MGRVPTTTAVAAANMLPPLLLLVLVAAGCGGGPQLLAHARTFLPAASISSSRTLLDAYGSGGGSSLPCCVDCSKAGDSTAIFRCFQNCQQQDCVSGTSCLQWTSSVADKVAQAACFYAYSICPEVVKSAAGAAAALAPSLAVTRAECYQAAKNVCETEARSYAQSGASGCQAYNTGTSTCDASTFQNYFSTELGSLCSQVASGVAVSLP